MTDDQKEVETETTDSTEEKKPDAETTEESKDSTEEASDTKKGIDYKAQVDEWKERAEKAEGSLAKGAFKKREEKRDEPEEEEEEEKPVTAKQVLDIVAKTQQDTRNEIMSSRIEDISDSLAGSEDEKELIKQIHKGITWPKHFSLEKQLNSAYLIANEKKITGENTELKRALKGTKGVDTSTAGVHQDGLQVDKKGPDMSGVDKQAITAAGFILNKTNGRYEKTTANGKVLYKDPKTGKVLRA